MTCISMFMAIFFDILTKVCEWPILNLGKLRLVIGKSINA